MAASWMDEETYKLNDLWSEEAIQALISLFFHGSVNAAGTVLLEHSKMEQNGTEQKKPV